jgi:hypothetical protein
MLFGSDCKNNTLQDVIGVRRGDTVGLSRLASIHTLLQEARKRLFMNRVRGVSQKTLVYPDHK